MGRGPSSLHRAGFLSTTVSGGPAGQVLSGASQPEQAFKAAQTSYREETPKQRRTDGRLCDLCVTNEGELVETSGAWRQALWLAEKHIITRVQTMVQSPILARYAAAAYRLRQKPLGVCCLSCHLGYYVGQATPVSPGGPPAPFLAYRPPFASALRLVNLTSRPGSTRVFVSWLTVLSSGLTKLCRFIGPKINRKKPRPCNGCLSSPGQGPTGFQKAPVEGGHRCFPTPTAKDCLQAKSAQLPRMDRGVRITFGTRYPWVLGGKQDSRMLGG